MRNIVASLCLMLSCLILKGQHRNDNWVFGDSAGINFSTPQNPINFNSSVNSRGTSACMSDTLGNLLFYYAYDHKGSAGISPHKNGNIYNSINTIMENGDSIVTAAWYMEGVLIPKPDDSLNYYLFHVGVTGNYGLYYSTIDLSYNNGLGKVTSKNNLLLTDPANDGLTAVKHGNGRDWWLLHRKATTPNNTFYKYLITPTGINGPYIQNIGSLTFTNTLSYVFNADGSQLATVKWDGLSEIFDFDRCTGLLSNHKILHPDPTVPPANCFFSCEFSASGRYLYIATNGYQAPAYLVQVDLLNPLGYAAADTVAALTAIPEAGGMLRRAPDNKIYWSCIYNNNFNFPYPYADSMYNMYNMNLSVINAPDSPGTACNFTPYSFYLGGARTYWGLPNNPNYDLPRLQGSSCDTVQWTSSPPSPKGGEMAELRATYVEAWQKLFVNAQNIKGKNATLKVYDLNGRVVFSSSQKTQPHYFTQDVDVSNLSTGMYVVSLETEMEVLNKKFVKAQ